jgi:hypothetical protein
MFRVLCGETLLKISSRTNGIGEIEGKAAMGSG